VSNVVEWILRSLGTPKLCIQAKKTSFSSFDMPTVSEKLKNTPKHHFGSNGVKWMLHNFGTLK
jgi:hypothetical protein